MTYDCWRCGCRCTGIRCEFTRVNGFKITVFLCQDCVKKTVCYITEGHMDKVRNR